jgi:enoyl-CoA hydratase
MIDYLDNFDWEAVPGSAALKRARHGEVGLVRIDRPAARNALNTAVMVGLTAEIERPAGDPEVTAIVVTGGPRWFAAGADITEMAEATAAEMAERPQRECWRRLRQIEKPMVAAVNGFALGGGCELALVCDLIVAGEDARFGQPEVNLGLMPGGGATQRLPRQIGKAKAMEMVLTGETVTAHEALAAGLVNRVVPNELVLIEAVRLAAAIASKPRVAVRSAKAAVLRSFELSLDMGLEAEREAFVRLFETQDAHDGMKAFLERWNPRFRGQ